MPSMSLFLLPYLMTLVSSLRMDKVSVPHIALGGGQVRLACNFDPEGEQVYSVKWYKGGQEIYRYTPSNFEQPVAVFSRPGVHIDQESSNSSVVTLQRLEVWSTGRYRCEVSTEAPKFSTASGYGDLLVIILPPRPPSIASNNHVKVDTKDKRSLYIQINSTGNTNLINDSNRTDNETLIGSVSLEDEKIMENQNITLENNNSYIKEKENGSRMIFEFKNSTDTGNGPIGPNNIIKESNDTRNNTIQENHIEENSRDNFVNETNQTNNSYMPDSKRIINGSFTTYGEKTNNNNNEDNRTQTVVNNSHNNDQVSSQPSDHHLAPGDLLDLTSDHHLAPGDLVISKPSDHHLAPGDLLDLTCTSADSKPAADLSWYINGKQVGPPLVTPLPVTTSSTSGLHTSRSSLRLWLDQSHFTAGGQISVSCVASIGGINTTSSTTDQNSDLT